MKILQIVKTNQGAIWAYNQAKWLAGNGVDIVTVLPDDIEPGMAARYMNSGLTVERNDFSFSPANLLHLFKKKRQLTALLNKYKPDIVHLHFVTNVLFLRLIMRDLKVTRIFQVPGPLHLESHLIKKTEIFLSQRCDYWIAACRKTREIYLDAGIDERRVFLGYYGNYSEREEYLPAKGILHEEYQIQQEKILVGMVSYAYKPKRYLGQQRGIKGHEDFIDGIYLARKQNPNILGVVIGGPWVGAEKYMEKIKLYAREKCGENIIFTGTRDDMKSIYKELDIAVHPSLSENLGGASESLAAGVPTISTNIGGFPDIVIEGVTGYLVEPRSPMDICTKILYIIDNYQEAKALADEGSKLVKSLLNVESTARKVRSIYESIT